MSENVQMELIKYINEGFNASRAEINSSMQSLHEKVNDISNKVSQFDEKFSNIEKRLDRVDARVEETNHVKEKLNRLIAEHEISFCNYKNSSECKDNSNAESKSSIWKEKWFSIAIITGCVILVVVVGSAIGVNIFEKWQAAQSLLGK